MLCMNGVWALLVAMLGWPASNKCEELLERAKYGSDKHSTEAFEALLKLANEDAVREQFHVAECYEQGWGTRVSAKQAAEWYDAAAREGHPVARIRVAGRKLMAAPDRRTMAAVLDVLAEVADQGSAQARVLLALATDRGLTASSGLNVSRENKQRRRFAFLLRYSGGMSLVELVALQNASGGILSEESIDDYRAAAAAGNVFASLKLAGYQDDQDKYKDALQLLNSAVATADASELIAISGYCRLLRVLPGRRDLADRAGTEAVAMLAIRVGRQDPEAARLLAWFYEKQTEAGLDGQRSRTWLEIEASMRRPLADRGDLESQYRLARLIEMGIEKSSEGETATHWFRQAAERGHARAQLRLGILLAKERRHAESNEWIESARKQGVDDASRFFSAYE